MQDSSLLFAVPLIITRILTFFIDAKLDFTNKIWRLLKI